jgi:predicted amidophosphoribosyltransferase
VAALSSLPTVLVPIPAARVSLRRRGFNPAAELARALSAQTGLPLRQQWLVRVGQGPKQSTLSREARLRGATGVYACPVQVPPCRVALVDDVMTTGSTLDAAARVLRAAGAASVMALVAARAPVEDGGTLAQYRLP